MVPISNESWDAAWSCTTLWSQLWRDVRSRVDADTWSSVVLPFLHDCKAVRATDKPSGRVLMHRAWCGLSTAGSAPGGSAFVLVAADGATRLRTTRQDVGNVAAYCRALGATTSTNVYWTPVSKRDAEFSQSLVSNMPAIAQLAFTARRTSAGELI